MVTSIKMLVEVVVVDGCLVMLLLLSLIFLLSIKKRAIMARPSSLGVKSVYCVKWNAVIYDFPSLVFVCVCQKELFLVGKLVSLFYYYSLISPVSPTFCLGSSPLFRLDPTLNVFLFKTEFWTLFYSSEFWCVLLLHLRLVFQLWLNLTTFPLRLKTASATF